MAAHSLHYVSGAVERTCVDDQATESLQPRDGWPYSKGCFIPAYVSLIHLFTQQTCLSMSEHLLSKNKMNFHLLSQSLLYVYLQVLQNVFFMYSTPTSLGHHFCVQLHSLLSKSSLPEQKKGRRLRLSMAQGPLHRSVCAEAAQGWAGTAMSAEVTGLHHQVHCWLRSGYSMWDNMRKHGRLTEWVRGCNLCLVFIW